MLIAKSPVHMAPFTGRSAWVRLDFTGPSEWNRYLNAQTLQELDRAVRMIRDEGKDLTSVTRADFPLPGFAEQARSILEEIRTGRGFVVLKGLPLERYSEREAGLIYWGIGTYLGIPLPQNVQGDRLYAVRDEGYKIAQDYGAVGVRFSKTTEGLHFHTDSAPALMGNTPDIVALLALNVAKTGGASALVSAQTAHNIMLRDRPDYLERLYQPYHFDRRAELRPGEACTLFAPVFLYDNGGLRVRYFRFYIPKGHELAGDVLTPADIEPLDYFEAVMNRPELQITFDMEPGDMQFVSNTFILHSRTAFEDYAEPERRRRLMRLWLKNAAEGAAA